MNGAEIGGPTMWSFSPSPEKEETATRVDAICAHRPDPEGPGLDREQLYWELRQLTRGITALGPYLLDRDSLWVNGEQLRCGLLLLTGQPLPSDLMFSPLALGGSAMCATWASRFGLHLGLTSPQGPPSWSEGADGESPTTSVCPENPPPCTRVALTILGPHLSLSPYPRASLTLATGFTPRSPTLFSSSEYTAYVPVPPTPQGGSSWEGTGCLLPLFPSCSGNPRSSAFSECNNNNDTSCCVSAMGAPCCFH